MTKRMKLMERLARDVCWAGFAARAAAKGGNTPASYWKSLPESTREYYRGEARYLMFLLGRLDRALIDQIAACDV